MKEFFNSIIKEKQTGNSKLKFTGERLVPNQPELMNLFQEHIIRYMFCSQFVKNKSVLDAGCGTGYGSYLLANQNSKNVVGIDNSKEAIEFAQNNFQSKNLEFTEDDCTKSNISDSSIDVLVAFELIEHLENPDAFLSEVNRVLKKNGLFILSTPNKITYNTANPFHYKEYTENEFVNFLKKSFLNVSIFYQTYPSSLAIHQPKNNLGVQELDIEGNSEKNDDNALYFLAVCSNVKLPNYSSKLFLFDEKTSLLKNFPIIQKQLRKLENELVEKDAVFSELQKEFEERSEWALKLDKEVEERKKQTLHFKKEANQKEEQLTKTQTEIKQKDEQFTKIQNEIKQKEEQFTKTQNEIKQKEEQLSKIQNELKFTTEQFNNLKNEAKQKERQLTKTQNEIKQKEEQLTEFKGLTQLDDVEIAEIDQEIKEKEKKISYYEKEVFQKDKELEEKNNDLKNLQTEVLTKSFELATIENSFIYKQMKKMGNFIDKVSPPGSKRREAARLSTESGRIIKNQGLKEFSKSVGAKIDSVSVYNRMQHKLKKPQVKDGKLKPSLTITGERLITPSKTLVKDKKLRAYQNFGFYNVTNLLNKPLVSIIIPTLNLVDLLKSNLQSIESLTTYPSYEIIIVTNNLDKNSDMRKFLSSVKHQVYVYEDEYSFSAVNNFAASKAKGEFLLFLNDDVRINHENWLEAFVKLGQNEAVGVVGGKLLFPNGKLQEAGGIIWKNGNGWNYGKNKDPNDPKFNFVREIDYCSGSCLFVKKRVFDKVGGFDTRYKIAYGEDADLCMAIKKLGYKILYQPLSQIIHFEGGTSGTNVNEGIKSNQLKNQKIFYEKWKEELKDHGIDSEENSYFSSNRKDGIHILYVDHYVPQIDKDAGSQNAFFTISILTYMGHKVTFWPENLHKSEPYVTELQQRGIEVITGLHNFEKFLKERGHIYSAAILCRPHIAIHFIDKLKKYAPQCKIIYEASDLYHIGLLRESEIKHQSKKQIESSIMREREIELMEKSDMVFFRTKKDCDIALKEDQAHKVAALHLPPMYNGHVKPFDERKDIIYVGGFQHPPNSDAVEYFISEIFPLISEKLPDVKFRLVGSKIPDKIKQLCEKTKNCEFIGYVYDLSSLLNECRIMVVPVRYGAGVKGKVTESMSHSLPVVTTSIGAEGLIENQNHEHLLISDDPREFADKTVEVYKNKELWEKISKNAKDYVENNFSPEQGRDILTRVLSSLNV